LYYLSELYYFYTSLNLKLNMKKIFISLSLLLASTISFAQLGCCNVVDSAGITVISTNGNCVITSGFASSDCNEEATEKVMDAPKVMLKESEKVILTNALEGVKFKTDSDELLPDSYEKLDAVAELMESNENYKLTIDGYTDNTGSSEHNHTLSYKRAEAAKARLIVDGIAGSRITTHGYGEERPVANNDTPEGRAKNRRVEFIISF